MLIIFDCDGVLVDSERLACEVDSQVLTSLGFAYSTDDILRRFVGRSFKDMTAEIAAESANPLPADLSLRVHEALKARFARDLEPVTGVRDAILALPFRRCVASSSTPERIALSLHLTGLSDLFDRVFSASEVRRGKPAPDLFLHAARQMEAHPDQCMVIEDSVAGVQAARAAGMRALGFAGGSHCGPAHADALQAAGAAVVITSMGDLASTLSRIP